MGRIRSFLVFLFVPLVAAAQGSPEGSQFSAWVPGAEIRITPASFSRELKTGAVAEAFRNEVVSLQLAVRAKEPLEPFAATCLPTEAGPNASLPCAWMEIRYPGYVLVDEIGQYVSDPLFEKSPQKLEANTTQAVWLTIRIPKDTSPGTYTGKLEVRAGNREVNFTLHLRVLDFTLPDMPEGSFYLNIWQDPAAVARWAKVPVWSEQHWELLEAYA
ncbi:MAG: hypothetical protein ABSA70_12270, partial [Terriglobia bacterium]